MAPRLPLVPAVARDEQGQVAVLMAAVLMLFALFGVLAVDVGMAYSARANYQGDVDLAALAAAQELPDDPALAEQRAEEYLEANGWDLSDPDTEVHITVYDSDHIEVVAKRPQQPTLGSLFGISFDVAARAVAQRTIEGGGDYAILVLDESECEAFHVQGNGEVVVDAGGIMVNSDCPTDSIQVGGNGEVVSDVFHHYYEGGVTTNGNADIDPWPEALSYRVEDPLAGIDPPDLATLGISPDSGGTAASPSIRVIQGNGSFTLRPGVYYGGLDIRGNTDVTLLPGIYAMAGGGFHFNGNADVQGDGVMFYNTEWDGDCGEMVLNGNNDLHLTGYTDPPYEGITFWQDTSCTETMTHNGNADTIGGVIYLPSATYDLSGNGDMQLGQAQIIVNQIYVHGNGDVDLEYHQFIEAGATEVLRLVE